MSKKQEYTPEQAALISLQSEIDAAKTQIETLKSAIAQQEKMHIELKDGLPDLGMLYQQREDLLAEVATGAENAGALSMLDEAIGTALDSEAKTKPEMQRCLQTVAGLQRKLQDARQALSVLQAKLPGLVRGYLLTEGNLVAERYLQHAAALLSEYKRLEAISTALQEMGYLPTLRPHGASISLPAFALPAFQGKTLWQMEGLIFDDRQLGYLAKRNLATIEADNIRALGIDFNLFQVTRDD